MCEYCENNQSVFEREKRNDKTRTVDTTDAVIERGCLHVEVEIGYALSVFDIPINYCPMCGQKLEVQDDTE